VVEIAAASRSAPLSNISAVANATTVASIASRGDRNGCDGGCVCDGADVAERTVRGDACGDVIAKRTNSGNAARIVACAWRTEQSAVAQGAAGDGDELDGGAADRCGPAGEELQRLEEHGLGMRHA